MANDTNGLDALVERIISDARSDAEKTLKLAAEQSEELQHSADELLRIIYQLGGDSYADHIGENGGVLLRS